MTLLRRIGCRVSLRRKRCNEFARRRRKTSLNRSPVTYSMLCLSGSGGTAEAEYSVDSVLKRKTKSVKRRLTIVSGFANEGKSLCSTV